jgi:hypothetical protein
LTNRRKPLELTIRDSEANARLREGALRVVKSLQFDPSDPTKPNPKYTYRVTVIFCLQPSNCEGILAFPDTEPVIVKATQIVVEQITP